MAGFATQDLRKPILRIFAEAQSLYTLSATDTLRPKYGFIIFNPDADIQRYHTDPFRKKDILLRNKLRYKKQPISKEIKMCGFCGSEMLAFRNGQRSKFCSEKCCRKYRYKNKGT